MNNYNGSSSSNFGSFWNDSNSEGLRMILDFVRDITGEMKKNEEKEKEAEKEKEKKKPQSGSGSFDVVEALGLNPKDYDYKDANESGVIEWITNRNEALIVTRLAYDKNNRMPELIYRQGEAYANFKGTCGLCSTANAARILRQGSPTEADAIDFASENGCCEAEENDDPSQPYYNGGTTADDRIKVAEHFGLYAEASDEFNLDTWFAILISGGAITFTVFADYLSKDVPAKMGRKVTSNHCITLIGLRASTDNEYEEPVVKEVIFLDTGGWTNNKYGVGAIPIEKFERMLKVTQYCSYNINFPENLIDELMK